jgi:hypothetical protein
MDAPFSKLLHHSCLDEQFDVKIIPIRSADVKRWQLNLVYRFFFLQFGFWEGFNF